MKDKNINSIEELQDYISRNNLEESSLETQESWTCSICDSSLNNGDLMHEYDAGWRRTKFICEDCWDTATQL